MTGHPVAHTGQVSPNLAPEGREFGDLQVEHAPLQHRGVQGPGDLVDVHPDPSELPLNVEERPHVLGREGQAAGQPAPQDRRRPPIRRKTQAMGRVRQGGRFGLAEPDRQLRRPGSEPDAERCPFARFGAQTAQGRGAPPLPGRPSVEPGREVVGQSKFEIRHGEASVHIRRREGYPALNSLWTLPPSLPVLDPQAYGSPVPLGERPPYEITWAPSTPLAHNRSPTVAYDDPRPTVEASPKFDTACPVEALACEAASLLRMKRALEPDEAGADQELIDALESPDDYVRPDELSRALYTQVRAIETLAAHRRPTSRKGALFQLYLAASAAQCPMGVLRTKLQPSEAHDVQTNERRVLQLHHAAIAFLETEGWDADMEVLRTWYLPPIYDVMAACERARADRAGLIADALAQPRTAVKPEA